MNLARRTYVHSKCPNFTNLGPFKMTVSLEYNQNFNCFSEGAITYNEPPCRLLRF